MSRRVAAATEHFRRFPAASAHSLQHGCNMKDGAHCAREPPGAPAGSASKTGGVVVAVRHRPRPSRVGGVIGMGQGVIAARQQAGRGQHDRPRSKPSHRATSRTVPSSVTPSAPMRVMVARRRSPGPWSRPLPRGWGARVGQTPRIDLQRGRTVYREKKTPGAVPGVPASPERGRVGRWREDRKRHLPEGGRRRRSSSHGNAFRSRSPSSGIARSTGVSGRGVSQSRMPSRAAIT